MPKFNAYPSATQLNSTDIMLADTQQATNTRKIAYSDLRTQLQNDSKSVFALKGEVATDEQVADAVGDWLEEHVTPTMPTVLVDDTLSIEDAAAEAKATGDAIDEVSNSVDELNIQIGDFAGLFSDDSTLLSKALSDASGTTANVAWSRTGNTLTANGTSTGNNIINWIASTTTFPNGIVPGGSYIAEIATTGTGLNFRINYKVASSDSWISIGAYTKSGRYAFTIPENATYLRIITLLTLGEVYDGTLTAEISKAVTYKDITPELNNKIINANEMFSDLSTLLSDHLTDTESTVNDTTYALTGNTLHIYGTATGNSVFTWVGSTGTIPSFIQPGKKYIITVNWFGTFDDKNYAKPISVEAKTTSNTAMHALCNIDSPGIYLFTVPSDVTAFRIVTRHLRPATSDGYVTAELSNAISMADLTPEIDTNTANISYIKTKYFSLSSDDSVMLSDGSDFNEIFNPGVYKVTNNTSAQTMLHRPANLAGKLIVVELSQNARKVQWYICANQATNAKFFHRYWTGSVWCDWEYFVKSTELTTLSNKVDSIDKKINVIYDGSGPWGDGTERLDVFVPASDGYILYRLYHYENWDTGSKRYNCDCWQVANVYHADDSFGNLTQLTISGEWECAIRLANRDDFSGGHTHGDERFNNITVIMDGKPISMSSLTSITSCNELRIIRDSTMYDPEDHTTEITYHGVEYVFDKKEGLTINQSLKWLVAEQLANCYMAMFLPSKNYIDRASANSDFLIMELASETGTHQSDIVKQNANKVDMWDTSSGFSAVVSVPTYPSGLSGGDLISISDNGNLDYNKLYFKICGSGNSTIGELWKSTSKYELNYNN